MPDIQPYTIKVFDKDIQVLKAKLASVKFPDELEDAGWAYGVPLSHLKRLMKCWKDYNWRMHEADLNAELPQFTVDIPVEGFETLNIHFVHKRSKLESAIPLLFVYGWPGSFLEVRKILPLLTDVSTRHPSFHVVALSLPNFGFSQGTKSKGFDMPRYAEVANKLMVKLGYDEYVIQGGDWGFMVGKTTAALYGPEHVKAWHTNTPHAAPPTFSATPLAWLRNIITPYSAEDKAGFERAEWFRSVGYGYFLEQATQPQTLGYLLADSPVGMLAWIYEKLINWTDDYPWTDDEVLTWVSVYWFSRAGPVANIRIYYEAKDFNSPLKPTIPMGLSILPRDISIMPERWIRASGNLVFVSRHEKGGHFAAHERPVELVEDVRRMFGKGGPAYAVVKGSTGYA